MGPQEHPAPRAFEFEPTAAVSTARAHTRFVKCPACQSETPGYVFDKTGVRFVRCGTCGMVYVNPARESVGLNALDIAHVRPFTNANDRALVVRDFERLIERVASEHLRIHGEPLVRSLLLGRFLPEFREVAAAKRIGLELAEANDAAFTRLVASSDLSWATAQLSRGPQLVILHELLESCSDPGVVIGKLTEALPASALLVVTYTNTDSLPARMMRRFWPPFFDNKTCFFSTGNLAMLMSRFDRHLMAQWALPVTHTAQYAGERIAPEAGLTRLLGATALRDVRVPVRAGNRVAVFGRKQAGATASREKLSIVLPVFNEARYAAQVIDTVLA